MRHLPLFPSGADPCDALEAVEIPVPCEVPWDSMAGNEQVRHCGACRQNVYNIASFTRPEALRLLASRAGRVCLRIFRRPDGTVLTSDCRERLRAARKRGWLVFAGALLVVAWAQICAQVVGLAALRRVTGGGVQGSPVAGALGVRGQLGRVPFVPVPTTGDAPLRPILGEPAMGHRVSEKKGELAGRVRVRAKAGRSQGE